MTTSTSTRSIDFVSLVAQLSADVSVLAAESAGGAWSQVPVVALADLTAELVRVRDLLGAVTTDGVSAVHVSGALPPGQVSTKRWLEVATGLSPVAAGAALARARSLREGFGLTRIAWLGGQLSEDMVRVITTGIPEALKGLNVADTPAVVARLEAELVPFAVESTVGEVRRKLARLRVQVDSDGVDASTLQAYDDQQFTLLPVGDGYEVRGWLTAKSAAVVLTCLDQTVDGWFRDGSLTPEHAVYAGDDALTTGRRRLHRGQLNAVALTELCERMLDAAQMGSRHQQRPHVLLTVDAEEYRAGLGGLLHVPGHGAEPITAAAVDRFLCDADVTTVLTAPVAPAHSEAGRSHEWLAEAAREVLYVGRAQRTAPPRVRKALSIRDRHCQFPDCAVTAERCHAHHVTHWEHGGTTDPANMVLLCGGHHHQVHEGGWTITRRPGARDGEPGAWDITPPQRPRWP